MKTHKMESLRKILEAMLVSNEPISARGVVRRSCGAFKHASDLTRDPDRRVLLNDYQGRQSKIRSSIERTSKKSRQHLEQQMAIKDQALVQLREERDLLVASHKAMILSVAQLGGIQLWRRYFQEVEGNVERLKQLAATPAADNVARLSISGPRVGGPGKSKNGKNV